MLCTSKNTLFLPVITYTLTQTHRHTRTYTYLHGDDTRKIYYTYSPKYINCVTNNLLFKKLLMLSFLSCQFSD